MRFVRKLKFDGVGSKDLPGLLSSDASMIRNRSFPATHHSSLEHDRYMLFLMHETNSSHSKILFVLESLWSILGCCKLCCALTVRGIRQHHALNV